MSATGSPGTAPSQPSESGASTRSITASETSGRAASCTSTTTASSGTSARPARTESARVSPPATHALHLAAAELLGEQDRRLLPARRRDDDDRVDPVRVVEAAQRLGEERILAELRERLRLVQAEPLAAPGGDEDRPDRHCSRGYAVAATAFFFEAVVFFLPFAPSARTSSSHSAHSSSSMFFAYISSEARIFFAFTNICFSPVERPFS